jgi:uncharacterized 2Fe-2S/4Fe-4S cluster protein (DUF4445 family)
MMPILTITYGNETQTVECQSGQVVGHIIPHSNLPLEQPCAGRGTCGKCKVIAAGALAPLDDIEHKHLLPTERAANVRLACRAKIIGDVQVTLMPIVVYSSKIFLRSNAFRTNADPLGLAIDLGSTTVAAFLVSLVTGEVYAGGAALNQQTIFGADVISRLGIADKEAVKLSALAQASIYQAIQSLKLSQRVRARIERAVIVCNSAMHHLLMQIPVHTLAVIPFQPLQRESQLDAHAFFDTLFPERTRVSLPAIVGGFVGSDTTACLAYFGFHRTTEPMLAIDLGTNGEVMVADGRGNILVASTAAGPAFEGVNISCGTRAVDGAIVDVQTEDGRLQVSTIGNRPAVGVTGSGLLSLIYSLRKLGLVNERGRLLQDSKGIAKMPIAGQVTLTQWDVRELQKAKAAIRVAADILLERLSIAPCALSRVILTGSFGGQLNIDAALALGLLPQVERARVELVANGAGLGAAMFLRDEGFAIGEDLAERAKHIELDLDPAFNTRFVEAMGL